MERFMESLGKDRRLAERHAVKTPLRLRIRKSEVNEQKVESENVSRRGVFFTTDLQLNEGAVLDLLLEMPEEITGVRAAQWICMGHVVRVVPGEAGTGPRGIGVEFDFYVVSHAAKAQWASGPGIRGPVRPTFDNSQALMNVDMARRLGKPSGTT
ncbi:MAG: PilZ domain-containing protein [Acidobacteria bacterium]|nr:PilZ domain-containing protein [Acidobacteriota bacterium]MBS1865722.1 PilZ domain-containing protein [Acidobacteriota bacterium]